MILLIDEDGVVTTTDDIEGISPCNWPIVINVEADENGRILATVQSCDGSWEEVTSE